MVVNVESVGVVDDVVDVVDLGVFVVNVVEVGVFFVDVVGDEVVFI